MRAHQIRVDVLEPAASEALFAMLTRCSPKTLYRRFHGVTDGTYHAEQVLASAPCGDSFVAWNGGECVGLADIHVDGETADVGILVEDAWQRQGVGAALLRAALRRVHERRSRFLRADVLEDCRFVLRVLGRLGSATTSMAAGCYTTVVDFGVEAPRSQGPDRLRSRRSEGVRQHEVGLAR
jgi:GNAT superfamily N-acetyltransferase